MEKKYIVELPDENVKSADGYDWLQLLISVAYEPVMVETAIQLLPYTEPDMEKVRKESCDKCMNEAEDLAYQLYSSKVDEAYQRGLEDMREVARKISSMDSATRDEIFGLVITSNIFDENTASEAIKKIKAYEQKQEQQIQVWDEVKVFERKPFIVTGFGYGDDDVVYCHGFVTENGISTSAKKDECVKTGRSFPEIAEVMRKMKESQ